MKTAISMPDSLFEAAELLAHQLGLSRSELYTRALQRYLDEHDDSAVTAALDTLYREQESSVDPLLARLQSASLPAEEWE